MRAKKIFLYALVMSLTLTGCSGSTIYSNYREIENLEVIRTLAMDGSEKGVTVTVGSGIGLDKSQAHIYERDAETLAVALDDMQNMAIGKETIFSHTEYILLGEDVAKSGIYDCIDYVIRASEMRIKTGFLIANGVKAGDVLKNASSEGESATDMLSYLEKNLEKLGVGSVFTCDEIATSLAKNKCAFVMSVTLEDSANLSEDGSEKMIVPAGFAVIKDGKLVDYFSEDASIGACYIMDRIQSEDVCITLAGGDVVTLSVKSEKTDITPEFENGSLKGINISLMLDANVEEAETEVQVTDKRVRKEMAELLADIKVKELREAIDQSQRLDADVLDLGSRIQMKAPLKFAEMPEKWEDIYSSIPIDISVSAKIERTYDMDNTIWIGEG